MSAEELSPFCVSRDTMAEYVISILDEVCWENDERQDTSECIRVMNQEIPNFLIACGGEGLRYFVLALGQEGRTQVNN